MREAYTAYRSGELDTRIEFVFSLRETTMIAAEMNYEPDVKRAIKDVVLPKIGNPEERRSVQDLLDAV